MLVLFRRFVLPVAVVVFAAGCWSQYRGDWSHSGNQPLEFGIGRGNASTLDEVWKDPTAGGVLAAPSISGGVAYVTSTDGKLYAFDSDGAACPGVPRTCSPLWTAQVQTGGVLATTPVVAGGVVYVQGSDDISAFDTAAGNDHCVPGPPKVCTPLWKTTPIGSAKASPMVASGLLYTTGAAGLYAFDPAGGASCVVGNPTVCPPVWTGGYSPGVDSSPTVAGGKVYVSGATASFGFDAAGISGCDTGTPRICSPLCKADGAASSPAVVNGIVYLAGGDHGLSAYDATGNGCLGSPALCTPLWSATLSVDAGEIVEPPAVANGIVYVTVRGSVFAFDAAGYVHGTGGCVEAAKLCTPLWQSAPGSSNADVASGAPSTANGVVYAGGAQRLKAYDASGVINCAAFPKTCDPLWASAPATAGHTAPVILGGTVYAGSADGLHAFQPTAHAPAPTIASVTPNASVGQTTSVTVSGEGFAAGLTVATTIPDALLGTPAPITPTSFTVPVTVTSTTAAGEYKLSVKNPDGGLATATIAVVGGTSGPDVASRAGIAGYPGILWDTAANRDADLQSIADAGAKWTALDLDWKSLQPTSTSFNWSAGGPFNNGGLDAAVKSARTKGLKILGIITYSPKWASPDCAGSGDAYVGHCFPDAAHVANLANFAKEAAKRYGSASTAADPDLHGAITNWQIWNEPNHREFSLPRPDPDRYAAMLKAVYPAIKGADSTATVITGGTAPTANESDANGQYEYAPMTWLQGIYDRGAGNSFDAAGHHPYSFPWNPLDDANFNAYSQTRSLYLLMAAHGDTGKKVWGTEMGVATGTYGLTNQDRCGLRSMTPEEQAQWVHDYYLGWNTTFQAYTGPLILKAIRDASGDTGNVFDNLGLLAFTRSPTDAKPAYAAYQSLTSSGVDTPRQGGHCYP